MFERTPNAEPSACDLCTHTGGIVVFECNLFRVVWADEPLYPGFLRLIWNSHVREFSHLSPENRVLCMEVVAALEEFVLHEIKADKCNLASLGNVVPHLHWHVIPRFCDDTHFPQPVWTHRVHEKGLCTRQQFVLNQTPVFQKKLFEALASRFKSA